VVPYNHWASLTRLKSMSFSGPKLHAHLIVNFNDPWHLEVP